MNLQHKWEYKISSFWSEEQTIKMQIIIYIKLNQELITVILIINIDDHGITPWDDSLDNIEELQKAAKK